MRSLQSDLGGGETISLRSDFLWQLLDALPAAIYVTDAEGRLTYFNRAAVDFSGRVPRLGTNQWCVSWRLYHTDGRPMAHDQCPMAVALKGGHVPQGVTAISERPDGTRVPFRSFPTALKDETGRIMGGINLLLDISDRDRAEKALLESEQRYSRLVGMLPVGVYTCSAPSGVITFYNEQAAQLWGRTPAVGSTDERFCGSWKLWRPDGTRLPHEETPMAIALREGRAFQNREVVIEREDGSRIWVMVNIDPLFDDSGELVGAINAFHDITALKQAEQELLRRTEQLSTFMETATVGLHCVDADGTVLWANEAELQLLGYSAEEYVGHHIAEFHVERPVIDDILARLQRGEKIREYEVRLRSKDGTIKTALIDSTVLWEKTRVVRTYCITRDITEQKRAAELRTGLAAIVDSTDDAVVGITLQGVITSWNKGAETMFDYSEAEATGQHIGLLIPDERRTEEDAVLGRLRRGEKVRHFETVRRRKSGELIDVSLSVSPIRNAQGSLIGAAKIARDITGRKKMEIELKEANRRKDEFIATLAHELRNPLAPLTSGLQILRMGGKDSIDSGETLSRMERQTAQLARLIDDLLDVSRISSGKLVLQRARVTLREVIDNAVETVLPAAKAKRQELLVALPGEPVYLEADGTRLCQIISNLLHNAVKYSSHNKQIKLTAARHDGELTVTIEDDGIGIPAAWIPQIFEPFAQLHQNLEGPNSGLGIGLALVKRLAELHGGSVQAYSEGQDKGSQFVVRLPVVVDSPAQSSETPQIHGDPRRILLVDDNRDAADSLGQLLRLIGHDVHTEYDGLRGLESARRLRPEVVILDIGLPGLDGYEICRAIKESGEGCTPLLIALTGWGQENDRQRAKDAGFDIHLVKPVNLETLTRAMKVAAAGPISV